MRQFLLSFLFKKSASRQINLEQLSVGDSDRLGDGKVVEKNKKVVNKRELKNKNEEYRLQSLLMKNSASNYTVKKRLFLLHQLCGAKDFST